MDLAITNTTVLTMQEDGVGPVVEGALGIRDGVVTAVGETGIATDADRVIDGTDRIVLPGLVDAHSHRGLSLLRGGAQDVPEIEWMHQTLGPFARGLTEEDRILGAKLAAVESLKAGVTTVCEYAEAVSQLLESVYESIGIRTVAVETINEVTTDPGSISPDEAVELDPQRGTSGIERTRDLLDTYGDHPRITPAYGPQAVDMVSSQTLEEIAELAARTGTDVHMHIAQGDRERRQVTAQYDAETTAVDVLDEVGLLTDRLVAVHLHGASPADRNRLVDAGARMVGCPSSIAGIDGQVPPVAAYCDAGGTAGLGTDQAPGSGRHDILQEARTLALLAKTATGDPRRLPAWQTLRLGTVGGAATLGLAETTGEIAVGKEADLVVLDTHEPTVTPTVDRPFQTGVPNLIYSAGQRAVETVVIGGEIVVESGSVVGIDEAAVVNEAQDRAEELFAEGADRWREAGSALAADAAAGRL